MGKGFQRHDNLRHAPFRAEFKSGLGWAIFDARDLRCSVWDPDGERMKIRADGLNSNTKPKAGKRPCLCCRASFASAGIHNRLCDRCRRMDSPQDEARPYIERRA